MSLLTPDRVETNELLDEDEAPANDVERSLRDLRRFNVWCGGNRAYRLFVQRLAGDRGLAGLTILDLGTGTSDLLESLPRPIRAIGLDVKLKHLAYGRSMGALSTHRVGGDALRLPFRDSSIDIVTSSHFLHHFDGETNRRVFAEALRVARIGVVVTDTRRHVVPWLFCKMLGWARLVGRITRFDAPASVLRGYTADEALEIASRLQASRTDVVGLTPYRIGILLWK